MPELPKEPGLRRLPVAHHGLGRHVQHLGRLFDAEPAEVPQFHDLTHPRVERRQSAQGIAQGDHIALFRFRQVSDVLDPLTDYAAATLLPAAIAGGLDGDPRLAAPSRSRFLPGDLAGDPERMQRFEPEARATSALNHPNVATGRRVISNVKSRRISNEPKRVV
jgi:hypothetical protein